MDEEKALTKIRRGAGSMLQTLWLMLTEFRAGCHSLKMKQVLMQLNKSLFQTTPILRISNALFVGATRI